MRMLMTLVALVSGGLAQTGRVTPASKVEVKNVHLCCGTCEKTAVKILDDACFHVTLRSV